MPQAVYLGWEFAYAAAMRLALRDRKPYESLRTLWGDATSRTWAMKALIDTLARGAASLSDIVRSVEDVWLETRELGVPEAASSVNP